jgi:hypothetical protein
MANSEELRKEESTAARAGTPGFFNSMTTGGKSEVRSPNSEVQLVRQSKLVIRHFTRAPVTLNWLTSRRSLFAGCVFQATARARTWESNASNSSI